MKYTVSLTLVLFGIWLLWSGHFDDPLLITLGALSSVAVVAVVRRMDVVDHEVAPVELTFRALLYAPWLVWEIAKANVDVARRILDPGLPIRPHTIRVKAVQRTVLARVVYANSNTLTPGTVSVELEDNVIVVHALTREAAAGLMTGEMARRVTEMEGRR